MNIFVAGSSWGGGCYEWGFFYELNWYVNHYQALETQSDTLNCKFSPIYYKRGIGYVPISLLNAPEIIDDYDEIFRRFFILLLKENQIKYRILDTEDDILITEAMCTDYDMLYQLCEAAMYQRAVFVLEKE